MLSMVVRMKLTKQQVGPAYEQLAQNTLTT